MRSQVELLLQQNVFCDQHGRYLHQPRSVEGFERQVAAAMAARLQHHPSGGPSLLRALAECAANGSSQPGLLTLAGGSAGSAALAEHPSPFDNQASLIWAAAHARPPALSLAWHPPVHAGGS